MLENNLKLLRTNVYNAEKCQLPPLGSYYASPDTLAEFRGHLMMDRRENEEKREEKERERQG